MSISSEVNRIKTGVSNAKRAITNKGVTVPTTAKVEDLESLISNIPQLDTSDATASASQILEGQTAYVKGNKVTGTLPIYGREDIESSISHEWDGYVFIETPIDNKVVEDSVFTKIPLSNFGDADSMYVAEGFKFTSQDGFCRNGTMPVYDYSNVTAEYSDETDDGFVFYGVVNGGRGAFVADEINIEVPAYLFGDAEQRYVAQGFTFTSSDGFDIEGELPFYMYEDIEAEVYGDGGGYLWCEGYPENECIVRDLVYTKIPMSGFGDADASHVMKGHTFTSASGYCIDGTMEPVSVATCTVKVTFTTTTGSCLTSATTFANGSMSVYNSSTNSGTITIPNVVCGSALSINTTKMVSLYTSASQQPHNGLLGGTVKIPATAGQTYTIEVGMIDD